MTDISIQLSSADGEYHGRIKSGVYAIIAEAEKAALERSVSKRDALSLVLKEHIISAGFSVTDKELAVATEKLAAARRGEKIRTMDLKVQHNSRLRKASDTNAHEVDSGRKDNKEMSSSIDQLTNFFEIEVEYPNTNAQTWYERLVGLTNKRRIYLLNWKCCFIHRK